MMKRSDRAEPMRLHARASIIVAAGYLGVLALLVLAGAAMAQVNSRSTQALGAPPPPELAFAAQKAPLPGVSSKAPRDGGLNRIRRFRIVKDPVTDAKPTIPREGVVVDDKVAKVIITQITPGDKFVAVDERVEVADSDRSELPFSAIGRLSVRFANGVVGIGTGFMAANGMVLTAAHVLHDPRYGAAIGVRFMSACRRGLSAREGQYSQDVDGSAVRVAARWTASQFAIEHDYGAVLLPDADWHERCGTLPMYPVDRVFTLRHADRADSQFIVSGFPAEKTDASMWIGRGSLAPSPPLQFNHRVDTTEGQSGSPVIAIMKDRASGRNVARVVAIHSRAVIYLFTYNIARPIEQRLIDEIAGWR
jgi:V8-like Glu-specific endopeptidase